MTTAPKTAIVKYLKESKYDKHLFTSSKAIDEDSFNDFKRLAEKLEKLFPDEFLSAKLRSDIKYGDSVILSSSLSDTAKNMTLKKFGIYKIYYQVKLLKMLNGRRKIVINVSQMEFVRLDQVVEEEFSW